MRRSLGKKESNDEKLQEVKVPKMHPREFIKFKIPFVSLLPFCPNVKHAFKTAKLPIAMLTVVSASFSSRGTDRQPRDLEDD
ncbi:11140_t:CDS:2, partial [Acaulospora morrowiae]